MDKSKDKASGQVPYAEHFTNIRVAGDLLSANDERAWVANLPAEPQHHQYVVWLGCQVLRTAHLPETLDDIFTHLSVDHVTLGGPANCCGVVHDRRGDTAIGENFTRQTVRKFDAFTPDQLLFWCPSCDNHLRTKSDVVATETTRNRKSVVEFLAETLTPEHLTVELPRRVAVHVHRGTPEQDAEGAAVMRILSMIPKLEIVDVPTIDDIGRHCSDNTVKKIGKDVFSNRMRDWIAAARRAGADSVVSLYHSCHRQLVGVQLESGPDDRLDVENYLSLLARSLALPVRDDKYARFSAMGDVDQIMGELSDRLRKTGINEERARRAIQVNFGREPAKAG